MRNAFDTLDGRVFLKQVAGDNLRDVLAEPVTCYAGFDPTGPGLQVGNLLVVMGLAQMQRHGHQIIALIGEATAPIGDPSGKETERPLLTTEQAAENAKAIQSQLEKLLSCDDKPSVKIVNNVDWLLDYNYFDFLDHVGRHFRVTEMVTKDSVKSRMESPEGMSFTEFNYMLMQAYDFLHLFEQEGCILQLGGSDQWSHITGGISLIKKRARKTAYGITFPLLTDASGKKWGKTESGTIWLDANLSQAIAQDYCSDIAEVYNETQSVRLCRPNATQCLNGISTY